MDNLVGYNSDACLNFPVASETGSYEQYADCDLFGHHVPDFYRQDDIVSVHDKNMFSCTASKQETPDTSNVVDWRAMMANVPVVQESQELPQIEGFSGSMTMPSMNIQMPEENPLIVLPPPEIVQPSIMQKIREFIDVYYTHISIVAVAITIIVIMYLVMQRRQIDMMGRS